MKTCSQCGQTLPLTEFHVNARHKTGHHPYCKACAYKMRHDYYIRNKEKVTVQCREWRHANPEKTRAYGRKYYWAHHEEKLRRASGWRKANPAKVFAVKQRRAEREGHTCIKPSQLLAIWMAQDGNCLYCGRYVELVDGHFDHRVSLAQGGTNTADNVVWSCASCNLSKNGHLEHPLPPCN